MTTEDTLPVVAWLLEDSNMWADRVTLSEESAKADDKHPTMSALVRESAALAALTLVQAERDAALVDAESWRQQADSRTADALRFGAERDAMQQERDELRALMADALSACSSVATTLNRRVVRDGCVMYLQTEEWCRWLEDELAPKFRAALTPKATQQETRA